MPKTKGSKNSSGGKIRPKSKPQTNKHNLGECDEPICPECNERKYSIIDYDSAGNGKMRFTGLCECGAELTYNKVIKI